MSVFEIYNESGTRGAVLELERLIKELAAKVEALTAPSAPLIFDAPKKEK